MFGSKTHDTGTFKHIQNEIKDISNKKLDIIDLRHNAGAIQYIRLFNWAKGKGDSATLTREYI